MTDKYFITVYLHPCINLIHQFLNNFALQATLGSKEKQLID